MLEISRWMMLHGQVDQLKLTAIKLNNQRYTVQETADILKRSKSNFENHLHQLGCVNHFDVWVLHKLSEKNLLHRISACDSLLKHNKNVPFLKQTVTGDEKWILCNNMQRKRSWASEMNHHHHTKGQSSSKEGDVEYRVYGGIGRESSIMSAFRNTKGLIPTSTAPN